MKGLNIVAALCLVWSFETAAWEFGKGEIAGPAAFLGESIVVHDGDNGLTGVTMADGAVRWQAAINEDILLAASGGDGRVFAVVCEGQIGKRDTFGSAQAIAIDVPSGTIAWRVDLGFKANFAYIQHAEQVIARTGPIITALDKDSGEANWKFKSKQGPIMGVTTADGLVVAVTLNGFLTVLDVDSGKEVWQTALNGRAVCVPAVHGGSIHVGTMKGTVYGFDATTAMPTWTQTVEGGIEGSLVSDGSAIYFTTRAGNVYALDAETGDEKWKQHVGRKREDASLFGSVGLFGDRVWTSTFEEKIVGFQAEDGTPAGSMKVEEPLVQFGIGDGVIAYKSYADGTLRSVRVP